MSERIGRKPDTTRDKATIVKAKTLRKNMTEVEKKLWNELRASRFENYKFRRQHPVGNYIVDFICQDEQLIIELDGGQHAEQQSYDQDQKRTNFLESSGYKVLRFWNNDITDNLDGVLETISQQLKAPELTPEEIQHGMEEMSEKFRKEGGELYLDKKKVG